MKQEIENLKHDLLKLIDKVESIEQSLINLKFVLKEIKKENK